MEAVFRDLRQHLRDRGMTTPVTVELVGQPFRIDVLSERDASNGDEIGTGWMVVAQQRIVVADNLAPAQERDTLLHEVLHGLMGVVGLMGDAKEEERVVAALTPLLLDALRRNPHLTEYLLA